MAKWAGAARRWTRWHCVAFRCEGIVELPGLFRTEVRLDSNLLPENFEPDIECQEFECEVGRCRYGVLMRPWNRHRAGSIVVLPDRADAGVLWIGNRGEQCPFEWQG